MEIVPYTRLEEVALVAGKRKQRSSFMVMIMMMMLFFCFMAPSSGVINCAHGLAVQPSARHSRQAIVSELSAGLTGTGTSFNSFGSKAGYLPQENDYYGDSQYSLDGYDGYDNYNGMSQYGLSRRMTYPQYGSSWRGFGRGKTSYPSYGGQDFQQGIKY